MLSLPHLTARTIVRIADGAPTNERERAHLARCARCRAEVQEVRALHDRARSSGGPAATEDLLARIHARVEVGDAVILPAEPMPAPVAARRLVPALAAAALALVAGVLWMSRPTPDLAASATGGELRFAPAAPHGGDTVAVEYRAPDALSGGSVLVLRARYRTAWDEEYSDGLAQRTVATLRRGADGVYRARIALPDSIVFGVFAVEDTSAAIVDDHGRRLWELLVHGADGRPTYDALRERENDLVGRNAEAALAATRERARLYPDRPDAWATLAAITQFNLGALPDSARAAHRARLAAFDRAWSARTAVPFSIANGLLAYAAQLSDGRDSLRRRVQAHWTPLRDSMVSVDPTDAGDRDRIEARWWRLNAMGNVSADSARIALVQAERFWNGAGRRLRRGAQLGAQLARQAGDTAAMLRWSDRQAARDADRPENAYWPVLAVSSLRAAAADRMAAVAERLLHPDDARRALEMTRAQAAAFDSTRARSVFGMVGDARRASGDRAGARAAYARATVAGWNASLARRAAAAALADGDTSAAVPLLARAAADPGISGAAVDSLRRLAGASVTDAAWAVAVAASRQAMTAYVLSRAVDDALPVRLAVQDGAGHATTLTALRAGRPAVVTFWSSQCYPSREQLRGLDSLGARLARLGAELVPVTEEAPSPALSAFLRERGVTRPVWFDDAGASRRAFGSWATPEYYVLDRSGRVRFRHSSLDAVLAQAAALADEDVRSIARAAPATRSTAR